MNKPRIFIGSSSESIQVARVLALALKDVAVSTVWDENFLKPNETTLNGLLRAVKEFDYAAVIWGPDDVTLSRAVALPSVRDNVMLETGLFVGGLGLDRVFVIFEKDTEIKIPSDYRGITLSKYDGRLITTQDKLAGVREASSQIADTIEAAFSQSRRVAPYSGKWRSKYCEAANILAREIVDHVEITVSRDTVDILGTNALNAHPYRAHGRIQNRNQILGGWEHENGTLAEGSFMLTVSRLADVMYGYCTGEDATGRMLFETWVLAKEDDSTEEKVKERLDWGINELKDRTLFTK